MRIKKKREWDSVRIAYWFGIDASDFTAGRKRAWLALLPRLQAERLLIEGDLSGADLDQLYDLKLIATGGDCEAAHQFKMAAYRQRLLAVAGNRE